MILDTLSQIYATIKTKVNLKALSKLFWVTTQKHETAGQLCKKN
jgi:hypothetical protein